MTPRHPFLGAVIVLLLLLDPPRLPGADLWFEFTFNDAGPNTQMTERSTANWALGFQNQAGNPVDLHGGPGSGVSGKPADRAFDNTASTGMGGGQSGGRATVPVAALPNCASFTLSGWFKTSDAAIGSFARLIFWDAFNQLYSFVDGTLWLAVNGNSLGSDPVYSATNEWIFFAVTYDSTAAENNVVFYRGTVAESVSVRTIRTLTGGEPGIAGWPLAIGNNYRDSLPTQPFDGWLDNFRMHGGPSASGVLSLAELESLRAADAEGTAPSLRVRTSLDSVPPTIPDPSSRMLRAWTIPGYRHQLQQSSDLNLWEDTSGGSFDGDGTQHTWEPPLLASPVFYRLKIELLP